MGLFDGPPAARSTDPITSHTAKVWHLNEDRVAVLGVHARHRHHGLTDYELASNMGRQQNSVGKRRSELRDHGYIEAMPAGDGKLLKRLAPSGSKCIVWVITPAGIELNRVLVEKAREGAEIFG